MSQIRSRGMKPELVIRSMVHRLGYRFRLHVRHLEGKPDLVLPRHRAVIFVNGCFWHWHPDPNCPIAGLPKSNLEYWEPKPNVNSGPGAYGLARSRRLARFDSVGVPPSQAHS